MLRTVLLIVTLLIAPASSALAWGAEGHHVVVQLALRLMKPKQRAQVYRLLGTHDMDAIGRWADRVRPLRPKTQERWHFVDIPLDAETYDSARDCASDCIIAQLTRVQATLRNSHADSTARREALLFWFHLIGDLYQPFHCYNNNDRGGNKIKVLFSGKPTNLHVLWDSKILRENNPSAWSLASEIYRSHNYPKTIPTFIDAANLSHARAKEALLTSGQTVNRRYLRHEWTVIKQALWEAACMAAKLDMGG